jgi:hypothetical protein
MPVELLLKHVIVMTLGSSPPRLGLGGQRSSPLSSQTLMHSVSRGMATREGSGGETAPRETAIG